MGAAEEKRGGGESEDEPIALKVVGVVSCRALLTLRGMSGMGFLYTWLSSIADYCAAIIYFLSLFLSLSVCVIGGTGDRKSASNVNHPEK